MVNHLPKNKPFKKTWNRVKRSNRNGTEESFKNNPKERRKKCSKMIKIMRKK